MFVYRIQFKLCISFKQHYIFAKLANLKPEMDSILKELKKETDVAVRMFKWDEKTARQMFHNSVCLKLKAVQFLF